ncbi:MAG TPA: glycosyltransferase family 4 protein [Anaerolineales bacterium]|nr:glycosyltransferase family 4 protein [Anaerolineales bacterium]
MRIGFVIYGSLDTVSGGYLYDRKLMEYLRAQGDTVEIISLPWRNYVAHLTDNFRFRLPLNLDILIQDELNHPSLIATNAGRHPYPIVSLVHHLRCSESRPAWQNWFYRIVEKKYLQSVDGFIFNSRTTQGVVFDLLQSRGDPSMPTNANVSKTSQSAKTTNSPWRVALTKPSLVAYPPTDRFGDGITDKEIIERAKSDKLRILFLGNVIYRKGLHTLLEAVEGQKSKVRVDVVGSLSSEPSYARSVQEKVKVSSLKSQVFFHGALDNEPLIEKLRQAHVLVLPSSYEGFGIAYLEGMCFGLPAIGTTAGAAREIIHDGDDGFLIEPQNADQLANRLNVLNEKREVLVQMSLAARSRYLRQPRWDETAESIRRFLQGMVETH